MRRTIIALLLVLPTFAFAQTSRPAAGAWTPLQGGGCIGGRTCPEKRLRIPLEDRPVLAVRLTAHDDIGPKAGGAVRVKIDGNIIENFDAVKRDPKVYQYDVDELRGRFLIIEAAENDEIEVTDVAVLYTPLERRDTIRRVPRDRDNGGWFGGDRGNGGWRRYAQADACIGGSECRRNGDRITIALDERPVLGVRFWAADGIGPKAGGIVNVRIDGHAIASYVDIKREGRRHEFDVDHIEGSRLVIETASNDEVDVKDIEVLYARGGRRGSGTREITHEGGCIGGTECGGRRARIRVALNGRPVESIRLYAHDEIGPRAGGELRIRIDDEVIEYALDVKREGRTMTIDANGLSGDYLYIEPAADDEVIIKDVRVRFAEE